MIPLPTTKLVRWSTSSTLLTSSPYNKTPQAQHASEVEALRRAAAEHKGSIEEVREGNAILDCPEYPSYFA